MFVTVATGPEPAGRTAGATVDVAGAIRALESGAIVAHPTETVYGLGCLLEAEALARLAKGKEREVGGAPFLILAPDAEWVREKFVWGPLAERLAAAHWPGAVTLVLEPLPGVEFPPEVRSSTGEVAVRMTPHHLTAAVVGGVGRGMVSTSCNRRGETAARTADAARRVLADLGLGQGSFVLDGGALPPSLSSTVVRPTPEGIELIRPGAVDVAEIGVRGGAG